MKRHFGLILLCVSLLTVTGCGENEPTTGSEEAGKDLNQGQSIYAQRCAACHARGLLGAPQNGDKAQWVSAIARGTEVLIDHSINGYRGQRGFMPPRGGHAELSDKDLRAAVHYLVNNNQ